MNTQEQIRKIAESYNILATMHMMPGDYEDREIAEELNCMCMLLREIAPEDVSIIAIEHRYLE